MKYLIIISLNDYKLYPENIEFLNYQLSLLDKEENDLTFLFQGDQKDYFFSNFFSRANIEEVIFTKQKEDKYYPKNYMGRFNRYLSDIKKSIFNKPFHSELFIDKWLNANISHPFDVCSLETLNIGIKLIEENNYDSIIVNNIGLNLIPSNLDSFIRKKNKFITILTQLHSTNNHMIFNFDESVDFWIHSKRDEITALNHTDLIITSCAYTYGALQNMTVNHNEISEKYFGEKFSELNFRNQKILILTNGNNSELYSINSFLNRSWKEIKKTKAHLSLLIAGNVENIELDDEHVDIQLLKADLSDNFSNEIMSASILIDPYRFNSQCSMNTLKALIKNIPIIALEKEHKLFSKHYKPYIRAHDSFIEITHDVLELISNQKKWKSFKTKSLNSLKKRFKRKRFGG